MMSMLFRPRSKLDIHVSQMETWKGENDMGLSIEILHYIQDFVIHFAKAKRYLDFDVQMTWFSHISIDFQILLRGAKSFWMSPHQSADNL